MDMLSDKLNVYQKRDDANHATVCTKIATLVSN